jgi:hypothetical protein
MTIRVVADRAGAADRKELQPHLVCSWTLDPAGDRLSCAWAPPAVPVAPDRIGRPGSRNHAGAILSDTAVANN